MKFVIRKARIPEWHWEIICGDWFHNIAATKESAVNYVRNRFGNEVIIIVKE